MCRILYVTLILCQVLFTSSFKPASMNQVEDDEEDDDEEQGDNDTNHQSEKCFLFWRSDWKTNS